MLICSQHWKHLWPPMVSDPCGEDWCRHSGEIFHSAVSWFARTSFDSKVHLLSAFVPSRDHLDRGLTLSIIDNRLCNLFIKLSGKHELSLAFLVFYWSAYERLKRKYASKILRALADVDVISVLIMRTTETPPTLSAFYSGATAGRRRCSRMILRSTMIFRSDGDDRHSSIRHSEIDPSSSVGQSDQTVQRADPTAPSSNVPKARSAGLV